MPISKRCPVHNAIHAGQPLRCLLCEPNAAEADWIRQRFTDEQVENWDEKDADRLERAFTLYHAEHCAEVN